MPDAESVFISGPHGIKLHVARYGATAERSLPVVCLPGLTRTATDFDALARTLAGDPARPRQVFALDYRGRGLSDYDRNPFNYSVAVELGDVLAVLGALKIDRAIFIGTSRGGILTMLLAMMTKPEVIAAAVLNDIGPVIDIEGLMRIKSYVGKMPVPDSFEHASRILRNLFGSQFPALTDADWLASAHRAFKIEGGKLVPTYDVAIAETLAGVVRKAPPQPMWEAFDALARKPVMVVRGELSDLLSRETVAAMVARHPGLETFEVSGQGHAPLLAEPRVIARIADFVARCDAGT